MLPIGNCIATGIRDPVGFCTDFRWFCVATQAPELVMFDASGNSAGRLRLNSRVRTVRHAFGTYQVSTGSRFGYFANGSGFVHTDIDRNTLDILQAEEWRVVLRRRLLGYGIDIGIPGRDNAIHTRLSFSGLDSESLWMGVNLQLDRPPTLCLCGESRNVFYISDEGVLVNRYPRPIHRLLPVDGTHVAVGHNGNLLYAYAGKEILYELHLPYVLRGVECSDRGDVIVRGTHRIDVIRADGTAQGGARTDKPLIAGQISNQGDLVALLDASGRIFVLQVSPDPPSTGIRTVSVTDLSSDGTLARLPYKSLMEAERCMGEWQAKLDDGFARFEMGKEALRKGKQEVERREAVVAERERDVEEHERIRAHLEDRLAEKRRRLRQLVSLANEPERLAARLERHYRRSLRDKAEAERLSKKVKEKGAFIAEARRRVENLSAELCRIINESAQLRVQQPELEAELEVRNRVLQAARDDHNAAASALNRNEEEYQRLTDEVSKAQTDREALEAKIAEMATQLKELAESRSELEQTQASLEERQGELSSLQAEIADGQAHLGRVEAEFEVARAESRRLATKCARVEKDIGEAHWAVESLKDTIPQREAALRDIVQARAEREAESAALTEREEELHPVLEELCRVRAAADEAKKAHEKAKSGAEALQSMINDLQSRTAEAKRECADLNAGIAKANAGFEQSQRDKATAERHLADLADDIRDQHNRLASLRKQSEERERTRDDIKGEITDAELQLKGKEQKIKVLSERRQNLAKVLKERTDEVAQIVETIKTMTGKKDELKARRQQLDEKHKDALLVKESLVFVMEKEKDNVDRLKRAKDLYDDIEAGEE